MRAPRPVSRIENRACYESTALTVVCATSLSSCSAVRRTSPGQHSTRATCNGPTTCSTRTIRRARTTNAGSMPTAVDAGSMPCVTLSPTNFSPSIEWVIPDGVRSESGESALTAGPYRLAPSARDAEGSIDRTRTIRFKFDGQRVGRVCRRHVGFCIARQRRADRRAQLQVSSSTWDLLFRLRGAQRAGEDRIGHPQHSFGACDPGGARRTPRGPRTQSGWPSVTTDFARVLDMVAPLWAAGFYNKTFMWPSWHFYEWAVRGMAGLGHVPPGSGSGSLRHAQFALRRPDRGRWTHRTSGGGCGGRDGTSGRSVRAGAWAGWARRMGWHPHRRPDREVMVRGAG